MTDSNNSTYNNNFEYIQNLTLPHCFICGSFLESPPSGKMGKTLVLEIFDENNNLVENDERICQYCDVKLTNDFLDSGRDIFDEYNILQRQRFSVLLRMGLV